jgi:phage shock protein A
MLEKRYKALTEAVDQTSSKVDKVRYENMKLLREIKELEISRKWFYFQSSAAWQD